MFPTKPLLKLNLEPDRLQQNPQSILNSLIGSFFKNDNQYRSNLSENINLSLLPDETMNLVRVQSITSSQLNLNKSHPFKDDEFDDKVRRVFSNPSQIKVNNYFENLSDHIFLDDAPNTPTEEDSFMPVVLKMAANSSRNSQSLFLSGINLASQKMVQKEQNCKESIHESLIVPKLNRESAFSGFLNTNEGSFCSPEQDYSNTFCNILSLSGFSQLNQNCEKKSLFELVSAGPDVLLELRNVANHQNLLSPKKLQVDSALKSFLVRFFTNSAFSESNCVFSDPETRILGSIFSRKYERDFKQ